MATGIVGFGLVAGRGAGQGRRRPGEDEERAVGQGATPAEGVAVTVEVRLPNVLRPLAGGEPAVQARGSTLREVFDDVVAQYPALRPSLLTPEGDMHRHLNVFVNDDDARYLGRLDARVGDEDTVTLMPAVAGG